MLSILFGTATAVAELGYLVAALVTGTRLDHWAVRLTEVELRRITRCHGPLRVDVALLHAPLGDEHGNLVHFGSRWADLLIARAPRRVIAQVDRLVPTDVAARLGVSIPGYLVDEVVEARKDVTVTLFGQATPWKPSPVPDAERKEKPRWQI